jgi:hypothetical protein
MQAMYSNAFVSKTAVKDWCRQFRQGRQSMVDIPQPGPAHIATIAINIAAVEAAVPQN